MIKFDYKVKKEGSPDLAGEVWGTNDICILFASSRGTGIETKKLERQDMSFVSK